MADIKQDIERIMYDNGDLLPESHIVDSKDHLCPSSYDQEPCFRGVPLQESTDPMGGFVPPGTSTPDNIRSTMRAPLSGSTVSGDGTGDGSHDGSTRDGDSDEARPLSGRVTGLRSVRKCKKRQTHDEFDDLSEEDEGSPSGRNKRVQANRLSAQRSRQRKLEKEASLRRDVEEQDDKIAEHTAKQNCLEPMKMELEKEVQEKREAAPTLETGIAHLEASIERHRADCEGIMTTHPHLSDMAPELCKWMQKHDMYSLLSKPIQEFYIRNAAADEAEYYTQQAAMRCMQQQIVWPSQQAMVAGYAQPMSAGYMSQVSPAAVYSRSQLPTYSSAQPSGPPHCGAPAAQAFLEETLSL